MEADLEAVLGQTKAGFSGVAIVGLMSWFEVWLRWCMLKWRDGEEIAKEIAPARGKWWWEVGVDGLVPGEGGKDGRQGWR